MNTDLIELGVALYMLALSIVVALGFMFFIFLDAIKLNAKDFKKNAGQTFYNIYTGIIICGICILAFMAWPYFAYITIRDELKSRGFFSKVG